MSFAGSIIGPIRIEDRIGIGGMGEVYRGFHERLERRVAVKTIRAEHRLSGEVKARFLREARLLSKLGHPGICQVYDLIETPEADFLVLEYVEGRTLKEVAAAELSFERRLRLSEQIATALAAAHRERIVHRDLKADNVMVTSRGEVKVLDFGIARSVAESGSRVGMDITGERDLQMPDRSQGSDLTQLGDLVGTAKAMSPEQARGGRVTSASDLYSLGILLQELFTGEPAYEASHPVAVLGQVMRAETRPISGLDPDLTALIGSLQSLDARRRPGAEATAERLRWILDRPQRQRRRRLVVGSAVAAFMVLTALLAVVSWLAVEASRARREADRRRKQAEALISFMLVDLRPKLETVGRVDLLDDVGDRALSYFDELPESELTDDELSRRVDAMRQVGEVRWLQGHLPEALAAFQRGRDLAANLVVRDPDRNDWMSRLADTQTWIGQVRFDQGRPVEARDQWKRALDIFQEQLRKHPGDEELLGGVAMGHHNLGTALDASGDLDAALREYRESLAIQRRAAARSPRDTQSQAELAATLAFVSRALERQGDLAGALAERREYVEISERGAALEPGSAVRRQEAATSRGFLAGLLAALGERAEARRLYESGLADIAELAGKDPGNAGLQRWLAAFHSALGALIADEADSAGGLRHLRAARKILEPLVTQDPTNADWRSQLGVCQRRTAEALLPWSPAAAREEARRAVGTLQPLLDAPPDEVTRGEMAEAEIALASAEATLGNTREARAGWERALAALAGLAAREPSPRPLTHWKLLAPRARALLSLGRVEEARPAVERLRRMGCQDRKLEELWREGTIKP